MYYSDSNEIKVRDSSDEKTNAHEQMHASVVGFKNADNEGRGFNEGATSFFSNDDTYGELQNIINIIGSIIGYDKLRDFYMAEGLDRLIQELEKEQSSENVHLLILRADAILDLQYEILQHKIDGEETENLQQELDINLNAAKKLLQEMVKVKYGKTGNLNLSKLLRDYSKMGNLVNRIGTIYGDAGYALDELRIILGDEKIAKCYESGNVDELKTIMLQYLPEQDVSECLKAIEENFNTSYSYFLENHTTPNQFPKKGNTEEYDKNERTYKQIILKLCRATGKTGLAGILNDSAYNSNSNLYNISTENGKEVEITINYYGKNPEGNYSAVTTKTKVNILDLRNMSTDKFRNIIADKLVDEMKITPDNVEGAAPNTRIGDIEEVRKEVDSLINKQPSNEKFLEG